MVHSHGLPAAWSADRSDTVHLRAFTEADLPFLDRLSTDPDALGEFEWSGFGDPRAHRKRWETDGYISAESAAVAVVDAGDTVVGIATWKPHGMPSGVTYEIGIGVVPEHRGRGIGTAAQLLLIDYLFDRTTANRIEALTNGGNLGEQKALERLGFQREGVMRGRSFLNGGYADVLVYGLLRAEHRPEPD